jgi:hypothetical protein
MRQLGVYGNNLETKKTRVVSASDFSIAGLYGSFVRKYNKPFRFRGTSEALVVLGPQTNPSDYGWDALNGFFGNLQGQSGTMIVGSYPGSGALQASAVIDTLFDIKAAFQREPCYGAYSNRVGFTLTGGFPFQALATEASSGAAITLDSIVGFSVGDFVKIGSTYHTVTDINESTGVLTVASAVTVAVGGTVSLVAYQLKTFVRQINGIVEEVDRELGKTWVTFNERNPDKYIADVFANSSWISITKKATATAEQIDDIDITYLTGGTDGTKQTTVANFQTVWPIMDGQPIRMIAAVETANSDVQKSLEQYCANREDNPIAIITGQYNMATKDQVKRAGQIFQRSNEVDAVFVHNWLGVADPFASSPTAPNRFVPPAGHVMGAWVRSIVARGIHYIPATKDNPITGVVSVAGYSPENFDRTELADAGVNCIALMEGYGVVIRNFFTPSVAPEFNVANAVLMRNFIKISSINSLQMSENQPNVIDRVLEDKTTIFQFMHKLWLRGSTGNVPTGETFGQFIKDNGTPSTEEEAYEVVGDERNNSRQQLMAGERNINVWFTAPSPAGSIKIGVGLLYIVS